jgi:ribonuclease III
MPNLPQFQDPEMLRQALTHKSCVNEDPSIPADNERLEFLGDAILNFVCGEFLYDRYPDLPEGRLTPMRSALVDESQLAKFAIEINLGEHMLLGKGAERDGGRQNPNLLSCTFEAIIGAYYLDCGSDIETLRQYVVPFFESVVHTVAEVAPEVNYKSRLQHWALTHHKENPRYTIIGAVGPDHDKHFIAEVRILGRKYGQGEGRSKQSAEKDAAREALVAIGVEEVRDISTLN